MIILLGATGYIGRAFAAELRKRQISFTPLTRKAVDYTRFDTLFDYLHRTKPAFVINAAGFVGKPDIDGCEGSKAEAVQANTLLPQTLARVCYLTKTPWGHISSGSIYSGARVAKNNTLQIERDLNDPEVCKLFDLHPEKFRGFTETDEPNCSFRSPPCSFYSGTKALAEESLRWFEQCYLWRPQIMFDEFDHPRNYLSRLQEDAAIRTGINSFTHRGDFVRACLQLWERRAPYGAYNIVNPGAASANQIAAAIHRILRREQQPGTATSPANRSKSQKSQSLLDPGKLISAGVKMRPLRDALEDSLKKWQPSPQDDAWMGQSNTGKR
ncbi:MAG: sugar nucleotide-binding protein [Verrucomicrobiota bacterium]